MGKGPINSPGPVTCRVFYEPVRTPVTLAALTDRIGREPDSIILGGHAASRWMGGWSLWAPKPRHVFECPRDHPDPMGALNQELARYRLQEGETPANCPFCGGWIGFFSYDLGDALEPVDCRARRDVDCPWIRLAFYDRWIAWDHRSDAVWLGVLQMNRDPMTVPVKLAEMRTLLNQAERTIVPALPAMAIDEVRLDRVPCNMSRAQYVRTVADIRRDIHDGEVYQVNLSQRFACVCPADPADLLHWQNQYNPSPYAALVQTPRSAVVSASPELFLAVSHGQIVTRPIKGTRRRRLDGPGADAHNRLAWKELWASEKDRAELTMIVDLERNDLARVCVPGTRTVVQRRVIEEYATVFHGVATITGQLARPHGPGWLEDILRATFPGGSITGAPKIRARQIIGQLEPTCRGVYTGAIGWVGLDDALELNIAIRTLFVRDGVAYIHAGGGIVADSEPDQEYEETLTKARALVAGVEATCRVAEPRGRRPGRIAALGPQVRAEQRKERGHGRPCP